MARDVVGSTLLTAELAASATDAGGGTAAADSGDASAEGAAPDVDGGQGHDLDRNRSGSATGAPPAGLCGAARDDGGAAADGGAGCGGADEDPSPWFHQRPRNSYCCYYPHL